MERFIPLICRVHAAVRAQRALKAVEDEQCAGLVQQAQQFVGLLTRAKGSERRTWQVRRS